MVASVEEAKVLLYGEKPAAFVEARDALVKQLRQAKERELAREVKGLRKPSAVAAEVNRVVRADPGGVEVLLQAAELLRAAQGGQLDDELLDVASLQEQYRAAIRALAQTAESRKAEVRAAIEAATIDIESNDALRLGALVTVPEPVSIFGVAPAGPTDELAVRRARRKKQAADKKVATEAAADQAARADKQAKTAKATAAAAKKERARALAAAKKELAVLTKQHRSAQRVHLDALDAEADAVTAVETTSAQFDELTTEVVAARQEIADLEAALATLIAERDKATAEHEAATSAQTAAAASAAEAQEATAQLAQAIEAATAHITELSTD